MCKDDKSLEENNVAFDLLSDCEPGHDASRVMYGIACARLEKLGKTQRNPLLCEINEILRAYFDICVGHSREGTPGLCASEARSLIRFSLAGQPLLTQKLQTSLSRDPLPTFQCCTHASLDCEIDILSPFSNSTLYAWNTVD